MSVFPKHQLLGENHMVFTVETAQLNNQSILKNFALVEEIDSQFAEIISGGCGCRPKYPDNSNGCHPKHPDNSNGCHPKYPDNSNGCHPKRPEPGNGCNDRHGNNYSIIH
ncbi:MAG: hypothetical protein V7K68_22145 [Nostoc sp.]|uniref:hypothetical protein n=1 Tax=Nostoc sp. TaxID=1180 RepID=UPI002FF84D1B